MFHVNDSGKIGKCRAKVRENCHFYREDEPDGGHYQTASEAAKAGEKRFEKENEEALKPEIRYSFLKNFKKLEEQFKTDFEGFPARFFNADLQGKLSRRSIEDFDLETFDDVDAYSFRNSDVLSRLYSATSSVSDMGADDEAVINSLNELGADSAEKIEDQSIVRALGGSGADRAFVANFGERQVVVLDLKKGSDMHGYALRHGQREPLKRGYFTMTTIRTVMGAVRAERKTGVAAFGLHVANRGGKTREERTECAKKSVEIFQALRDAQFEGSNFQAQKKYVKEKSGTIATVWDDKKGADKVHQDLMNNTRLNKVFSKVEIDNDVDPVEYADFEDAVDEALEKLPPIPADRRPAMRLRRLGKHNATGLYAPALNTVAIDIRNSASTIHELGHYYDFAVKNNASLTGDFRNVVQDYSRNLRVPAGEPKSRRDYLATPTEVLARSFEMYAHEKLGINNRLLDPGKFDGYDYKPLVDNPDLKERAFAFFDNLFPKND